MTERFVENVFDSGLNISLDQWMVLGPVWQLKNPSHKDLSEFSMKDKTSIIIKTVIKKTIILKNRIIYIIDYII